MKYSNEIVIDRPVNEVTVLFKNPENMHHWQDGFLGYEPVHGEPGTENATARLHYKMGKRDIEMKETVQVSNLPEEYTVVYETKGVWNRQVNHFQPVNQNQTRWVSKSEFKFSGFMMKLFGLLMPGAFKKQSQKYLDDFKAFAEDEKQTE